MKKEIIIILAIFLISIFAGCSNNPCKNINCPDVCHGNELWSQFCQNGVCVDNKQVDDCSEKCGCNPTPIDKCADITCEEECFGDELWSTKCVEGECVKQSILNKCNEKCGCQEYTFVESGNIVGLSGAPDCEFVPTEGPGGQVKLYNRAKAYHFQKGDLVRVNVGRNLPYKNEEGSVQVKYLYLGNEKITSTWINLPLPNGMGKLSDIQAISNPEKWQIMMEGNYLIWICEYDQGYYIESIGLLFKK